MHPQIDNPEYKADSNLYLYEDIGAVAFDLWQVKSGTIFDNILVTDDPEKAKKDGEEVWKKTSEGEKKMKEKQDEEQRKKEEEEEKKRKEEEEAKKKEEEAKKKEDETKKTDEKKDVRFVSEFWFMKLSLLHANILMFVKNFIYHSLSC